VIYIFVAAEAQHANHSPQSESVLRPTQRVSKLALGMASGTLPRGSPDARSIRTPDVSTALRRVVAKAEDITGHRIKEALRKANDQLGELRTKIVQYSNQEAD